MSASAEGLSARDEVLARIRMALTDRPAPEPVSRDYRQAGEHELQRGPDGADGRDARTALLNRLVDRLVDYRATVHRADAGTAAEVIAAALDEHGARRVVAPAGFPPELLAAARATVVRDDPPLSTSELDGLDGVLTTCALAVAETGTVVLDSGPGQGRRALTLVPDYHLIVVGEDQVVANVPDAVALLDATRPLTWISGPSATSDIELSRVEGVHGPRTLVVVLVSPPLPDGHLATPLGETSPDRQ